MTRKVEKMFEVGICVYCGKQIDFKVGYLFTYLGLSCIPCSFPNKTLQT